MGIDKGETEQSRLIFERSSIRISARTPAIPTEVFREFPESL
jgi:hypothetical protein